MGEPTISTRDRVLDKPYQEISRRERYILPPIHVLRKGSNGVVSAPRETEGKEKGEGSLSILIVPLKGGKFAPGKPLIREGGYLITELHFRNIKCTSGMEIMSTVEM
jgi:hypothetical protein